MLDTVTRSFGYNAANQLISEGGTTLTYDLNGNLLNDGTNAYVWDRANRLLSMGGASYAYDGDGDRVSRTVGGTLTRYTLDKQSALTKVLAEDTGSTRNRYVHGPMGIFGQQNSVQATNWSTEYLLEDGLGSIRALSDGLDVLSAQEYSPYGEQLETAIASGFGFTGEQTDALNDLVYLRARYLNPRLGVFASLDPWMGSARQPLTLNNYSWVNGNTSNKTDPSGLFWQWLALLAASVATQVAINVLQAGNAQGISSQSEENQPTITPQPTLQVPFLPAYSEPILTLAGTPTPPPINTSRRVHGNDAKALLDGVFRCLKDGECDVMLLGRKPNTIVDGMAVVVERLAFMFPNSTTQEISDAMSWAMVGTGGPLTYFGGAIIAGVEILRPSRHPINEWVTDVETSGFHSDFYQPFAQSFHFWAMLNTRAQGGNFVASLGHVIHECHGFPTGGGTVEDAKLGAVAIVLGDEIYNGLLSPQQLANRIREELTADFAGQLPAWYFANPACEHLR